MHDRKRNRAYFLVTSIILLGCLMGTSSGAGFVRSDNFMVLTPPEPTQEAGQEFAKKLLAKAEEYRSKIAKEWLPTELPPSVGLTVINLTLSETEDSALTWAKDHPDRIFHTIYLTTQRERALGSTLAHEIAHVVLATAHPHPKRLAPWIEEGIASRYDSPERHKTRASIIQWYARTGNWPSLPQILDATKISSQDKSSYAVAASLTDFLLSKSDKAKFMDFAQAGQSSGWDAAIRQCYGMQGIADCERKWRKWASL